MTVRDDPSANAPTQVKALTPDQLRGLAARDPNAPRVGPYVLQHRLGAGGMAEVWLAFNAGSDASQQVVIKRILPHFATEPRYVEMFRREAAVSMGLDHENIVRVFGLVEDGGEVGLVMEYLEGLTLFDLAHRAWRAGRPLPLEPLVQILRESARALAFAHDHRSDDGKPKPIVHRDVSPDNLLVTKQGVTKLLDFGVAKPEGEASLTRTGQIKGKVSYMSPEQVRGQPLDGRSDLFSLGVTFYWLLAGVRPFDRDNPVATMEAVVKDQLPRPSEMNPQVPLELEIIVLRLLEKDRRFRTQNGQQLVEQLTDLLKRVPDGHLSPRRLLEEVTGLDPQLRESKPTYPAVRSVDWRSGEVTAPTINSPSLPAADVDRVATAQFPVFGRLVDASSGWGEVFTQSNQAALVDEAAPVPKSLLASGERSEPSPLDEPDTLHDPSTIPMSSDVSQSAVAEGDAVSMQLLADAPSTVPALQVVPPQEPPTVPLSLKHIDDIASKSTLQQPAVDIHGRPTVPQQPQFDIHGRPTLLSGLPAAQPGLDAAAPVGGASTIPVQAADALAALAAIEPVETPHPDTIPHPLPAPRADMRAEDISVPSKPVVTARKRSRRALVLVLLLAAGLTGGGAWLLLNPELLPSTLRTRLGMAEPPEAADPAPQTEPPAANDTPTADSPSVTASDTPKPETPPAPAAAPDAGTQVATTRKPPPDKPPTGHRRPRPPKPPAVPTVEVSLKAPGAISWQTRSGTKLGRGKRKANIPEGTTSLIAVDSRRGIRTDVLVKGGTADYLALRTERLVIVVRPWAKVWLGTEELGPTPLKPVPVVPGTYKLRFEHEGKTREETVVVKPGDGRKNVRVDMRG